MLVAGVGFTYDEAARLPDANTIKGRVAVAIGTGDP